jgi:hypothetical protein
VWATENTREAIFDAMKRRETYATTGPRMACASSAAGTSTPRTPQPHAREVGYAKGVPMGGDLNGAPRARRRPSSSRR